MLSGLLVVALLGILSSCGAEAPASTPIVPATTGEPPELEGARKTGGDARAAARFLPPGLVSLSLSLYLSTSLSWRGRLRDR